MPQEECRRRPVLQRMRAPTHPHVARTSPGHPGGPAPSPLPASWPPTTAPYSLHPGRPHLSCANSHPLFNQTQRNAQLHKRSIIRVIINVAFLSLLAPFYLVKKACSIASSGSWSQKIVSWATLFLLVFGASSMGLIDGCFQLLGENWSDFSLCDCIQVETKDLRSLIKATHILERKAGEIPLLKEELQKLESQLRLLSSDVNCMAHRAVSEVLQSYTSKGVTKWGLKEVDEDDGTFLGQFVYDAEGNMIQTFKLKGNSSEMMNYMKLKVLSNWGDPKYTCIYRFRVHGDVGNN